MPGPGPSINSSLQQIMDISNRMGLFLPNPSPIQPMQSSGYMPTQGPVSSVQPSLNAGQQKQVDIINMQNKQQQQQKFNNIMGYGMGALSFIDNIIPEQKIHNPVVRPLESYNPNPYGTGSQAIAANGIHIDPSKKGTFTAAAKKHGKGVQEFARQVLAHRSNYSPAMVKKANFAHNAAGWHKADMGMMLPGVNGVAGGKKKAADGLTLYGGPGEDPQPATYKTQAEVDAANLFAKEFSKRQNNVNPGEAYVARKPGDQVVQFIDTATGKPYDGRYSKMPRNMIQQSVPDDITELHWDHGWNQPYYLDGDTKVFVDRRFYNADKYILSDQKQQEILAMRNGKMKNGGKMKGGKRVNGAKFMEGQSYDLDHDTINQLLSSGFQLDFE